MEHKRPTRQVEHVMARMRSEKDEQESDEMIDFRKLAICMATAFGILSWVLWCAMFVGPQRERFDMAMISSMATLSWLFPVVFPPK